MTISTTTSTITYLGNGSTTVFSFPFVGDSAATLQVYYTNANGVVTQLSPSQYTLFINAPPTNGLWGIGGTVTYPNTGSPPVPIAAGTFLSIVRAVPYTQTISINNQGAFYPQVVEQGLDLLELQIQQLNTDYAYTIKTPITDLVPPNTLPSAATRANGYLAFDSTGQPIIANGTIPTPTQLIAATPRRVTVTGTSTVNVLTSDNFGGVSLYQSGSAVVTVQLPTGQGPFPIFDASQNCNTFPIKILPPAGLTIEGKTTFYMTFNGQSVELFNDGNEILVL